MSLQQALDDCLIDFDRRVLVTDLLEKYKLTYKEAHEALEAHIKEQERASANKYEKRFLVHGMKANGDGELYTIVQGEDKLREWLSKLEKSQSQLYSVEIAGGSKSAAPIFKPMQHVEVKLAKLEQRAGATPKPVVNGEQKPLNGNAETAKPTSIKVEASKTSSSKNNGEYSATEQLKKESPTDQKGKGKATAAATKKGSINSFFSTAPAGKAQPPKETKAAAAKTAAGSMENFFKKQPTSTASQSKKSPTESVKKDSTAAANTSVQLFEAESEASSDEEEKLDKLRRKVVGSGDESDEVDAKPSSSKRRRISDSEDEEQPQKKSAEPQPKQQEEREKEEAMDVEAATNETFLDDDGFVITVRPKKQTQAAKKKTSPTTAAASAPTSKKKTPPAARKSAKETPKTKQSNISSFFTKK
ncbi:LOW QUALITY PROTEIN: histone H1.2 [Drosophila innubila]|uniref:LOW QUALITY PROTEIN: histone H1.2 n=1 Tax=Drosophila innubila TaxID=198719 RepID=UPI00148BDEE6|nr:LOW QUALITY PROTEIN: histone H1.2 [Drosophila innubila]